MSEDLWAMIEAGAFRQDKQPLSKRQQRLRTKAKRNEELARVLQEKIKAQKAEVRSMLNWVPQARIYVVFRTTCSCGSVFQYPEIFLTQPTPFIRFKHKLNNTIWEKRLDPGEALPATPLPAETRVLEMHSDHCSFCRPSITSTGE